MKCGSVYCVDYCNKVFIINQSINKVFPINQLKIYWNVKNHKYLKKTQEKNLFYFLFNYFLCIHLVNHSKFLVYHDDTHTYLSVFTF